jgi:hypothetical protein
MMDLVQFGRSVAMVGCTVILIGCGSGTTPSPSTAPVTASGAPTPTASPGASASATAASAASPTAAGAASPTLPAETPSPTDVSAAKAEIDAYTAALVRSDYPTAWAMLAPEAQAAGGSLAAYADERGAFFKSVAGQFKVGTPPAGTAPITSWLSSTNGASIDLRHAVLLEVDYPALANNNAGYDLYIVNPRGTGLEIFNVR